LRVIFGVDSRTFPRSSADTKKLLAIRCVTTARNPEAGS